MTTKWMLYAKKADFNAISAKYHITPITARIIRNRDVCGDESIRKYLYGTWEDLYSPYLLKDAELAARLLLEKIKTQKKIRIVGDYDIDGVCSTYILYRALNRLNARVDYEIPDRIKDGYGINEQIVEQAAGDHIDTILTCDNGISAHPDKNKDWRFERDKTSLIRKNLSFCALVYATCVKFAVQLLHIIKGKSRNLS